MIAAWRESPSLHILLDSEATLERLALLAREADMRGGRIHDARIAACCFVSGVLKLWTVDRDFSRFPALKTRNPLVIR